MPLQWERRAERQGQGTSETLTETKRNRDGERDRERRAERQGQGTSEMQTETQRNKTRILRGNLRDRKTETCKRRHRDQDRKRNKKKYRQ